MFGRKKDAPKERRQGGGNVLLNQMGMNPDMSAMDAMIYGDDDDDEELEAELLALQGQTSPNKTSPKKGVQEMVQLDRMIAASMRDIPSDEDVSDTEDPDLLAELNGLSTEQEPPHKMKHAEPTQNSSNAIIETLEERLAMYLSILDMTKTNGDSSKARRVERGVKTLQDLLKKARSGRPVTVEDIPPSIAGSNKSSPASPSKPPPSMPDHHPPHVASAPLLAATLEPTFPSASMRRASSGSSPVRRPAPPPPPCTVSNLSVANMSTPTATPAKMTPPRPAPASPSHHSLSGQDSENHKLLSDRRDQYKLAAMRSKQAGYGEMAMKYLKTAKQFDRVLQALEEGKPIDLSKMPPPPPGFSAPAVGMSTNDGIAMERSALQGSMEQNTPDEENLPTLTTEEKQKLYHAPTSAGSVSEALKQRLDKYMNALEEANTEGAKSKVRRMSRIVKQYEEAIKAYKSGKHVDFEELPTPPGYPPIPVPPGSVPKEAVAGPMAISSGGQASSGSGNAGGLKAKTTMAVSSPSRTTHTTGSADQPRVSPAQGKTGGRPPSINRQASLLSRAEQQSIFLLERQLQYKKAAFKAKKSGEIELAKKYLRMSKGFDQMIEAASCGLPVDMSQVPPPPGSDDNFEFVEDPSEVPEEGAQGDRETMYKTLEQELINQYKTCITNAEHFTHLGDVSSAAKFEKMGQNARKDMNTLKNAYTHGDPVPRFHYETRTFTLVQSCTDLGDNDLELTIFRGINLGLPQDLNANDLDTYIKYDFPFPNDGGQNQKGTTDTIKGTNNPEYNHSAKLNINRKARSFLRLLKSSKTLKLEIFYKRGFFKGDKLLGTASIKLQNLESKCIVHDCYDLSEGRKHIGGKLEVKMRVRDPFVSKHVEEVKEKWLVIDVFNRAAPQKLSPANDDPNASMMSMEVMKYEKQLLDKQIQKMTGKLSKPDELALRQKSELLNERIEEQRFKLRQGGVQALKEYSDAIETSKATYLQEAQQLVKKGNKEKAQVVLNKKKCVERELEAIRAKLGS